MGFFDDGPEDFDELARYRKLPGTSGRYEDLRYPGETISRRQYENIRARAMGYRNYSDVQKVYKQYNTPQGKLWLEQVKKRDNVSTRTAIQAESSKKLLKAQQSHFSKEAHGDFADFLEYVGLREVNADYDVGDTGKQKKGK